MEQGPIGPEQAFQPQPQPAPPPPPQVIYRGGRAGFWIAIIFGVLLLVSAGLNMFLVVGLTGAIEKGGSFKAFPDDAYSDAGASDKIAVIRIEGLISDGDTQTPFGTMLGQVSTFKGQLSAVEADPDVKAVILEVDSPGGYVTASDEIHHLITEYKSRAKIPVIVFMKDVAASGGYYVSAPADWIVAMPTCTTGSIGVIAMLVNVRKGLEEKLGVTVYTFKSGEMKDAGSPFRDMTDKDKQYFQDSVDGMYKRFLKVVYDGRGSRAGWSGPDDPKLKEIANGAAYDADEALEYKLIDEIGYFETAVKMAKKKAGLDTAKVVRYQYVPSPRLFGLGGANSTNINTGLNIELDTGKMPSIDSPKFMYYWKP